MRADSFAFHVFERFVFIGVFRLNNHDETDIVVRVSKEHLFLTFGRDGDCGGTDIHHIGDSGYVGMALPENITAYSVAIRGIRHTYRRMAMSLARRPGEG